MVGQSIILVYCRLVIGRLGRIGHGELRGWSIHNLGLLQACDRSAWSHRTRRAAWLVSTPNQEISQNGCETSQGRLIVTLS